MSGSFDISTTGMATPGDYAIDKSFWDTRLFVGLMAYLPGIWFL